MLCNPTYSNFRVLGLCEECASGTRTAHKKRPNDDKMQHQPGLDDKKRRRVQYCPSSRAPQEESANGIRTAQQKWPHLEEMQSQLGLDVKKRRLCMSSHKPKSKSRRDSHKGRLFQAVRDCCLECFERMLAEGITLPDAITDTDGWTFKQMAQEYERSHIVAYLTEAYPHL